MNGVDWLAQQIAAVANRDMHEGTEASRFNPRPPGVIRDGSATQAVFAFLDQRRGVFFTRLQIVTATGRSERAVDWALLFLKAQQKCKAVEDINRNPRYLRYGIAKEGDAA